MKKCSSDQSLRDHEKRTTYHCHYSTRSFGIRMKLKSHIQNVHERVKCNKCGQEMCNTVILKRHKAKVQGVMPTSVHQCTVFRKAYILSGSGFHEFLYSIIESLKIFCEIAEFIPNQLRFHEKNIS